MARGITPEFKERVLARVDLVELIGARVALRRVGKEYLGLCPFHNEKTPSFTVVPDKQFYHCFGCGANGNAIDFLIQYDRLDFPEAVTELARQAGMDLPNADAPPREGPDPRPLYDTLAQAAAFYQRQLRTHPQAQRAVDYLKGRGLSGTIAARFGLGFAPPGWDALLAQLGAGRDGRARLAAAGLIIERDDGRCYDRFRDRIMFPIHDRRGRVLGFGGRILDQGEPKYLNSPETAVFHKGRELYGLYQARAASRQPPRLLVVEGYLDVIALAQFELPYAVATLGTATTPEQLTRLLRSAPELVFCFDGDRAGRAAAWKALTTALPQVGRQQPVRFLFLPEGEDPDTLVRKEGRVAFEQRLTGATPLSTFLFEHLSTGLDLTTAEGRAALDAAARPLLERVPAGTYRGLLAQQLARLVGLPPPVGGRAAPRRAARVPAPQMDLTRRAIALLLDEPGLAAALTVRPTDWSALRQPGADLLQGLLAQIDAAPGLTGGMLRERLRDSPYEPIIAQRSELLAIDLTYEGKAAEVQGAIERLNEQAGRAGRARLWEVRSLADLTPEQRTALRARRGRPADH